MKCMSWATCIVLCAAIGGCASTPTYLTQTQIARSYAPYAYGPVISLVQRIGAPTRTIMIGNHKVYVWHGTATWRGRYPVGTIHHGTISTGNAMDGPGLQYTDRSTQYVTESSALNCDLEVYVDDKENVINVMVRGQNGACQQFML